MNKKVAKGALAAVAAVLLLLGGAGSYALWSDSDTTNPGNITAGTLDIAAVGPGTWTDVSDAATPKPIANITNFRIVPGDTLEYTASFKIAATGDNLRATVTGTETAPVVSPGLADRITTTTTANIGGNPLPGNVITQANNGNNVDVTIRVVFDRDTPGQVGQGGTINLSNYQVTLQQVRT